MVRRDDDALSWGDDDPTLDDGVRSVDDEPARKVPRRADAASAPLPQGFTAVGRGSDSIPSAPSTTSAEAPDAASRPSPGTSADHEVIEDEQAGLSNAGLLALGVLGGVYLLFAIGWLIAGLRLQPAAAFLVAPQGAAPPLWMGGNLVAVWLAVLAGPIWFATVYVLTARSRAWLRWLLLVIGAVLIVPWPFVMVGTVGS